MSHRDTVFAPPPGFDALASSTASPVAAFESAERGIYGIQFHPEVVHTPVRPAGADELPRGRLRLRAHVEPGVGDRGADRADPRPGRRRAGDLRALRRRRLERRGAARPPRDRRPADVRVRRPRPDAQERGRAGDRGVPRPLQGAAGRRRRLGAVPRAAAAASPTPRRSASGSAPSSSACSRRRRPSSTTCEFLVQGTLYSDVIESGGGTGAATIKSHHNVGGLPDDLEFELVEPLRTLFKDEVRAVGAELGLPERLVWRQPFPGPGLAIRIVGGEATRERLDTAARGRRDPPGRDPQGRPLPRAVAVVLRAARHPHGRGPGRRAHLRERDRDPRGDRATTR